MAPMLDYKTQSHLLLASTAMAGALAAMAAQTFGSTITLGLSLWSEAARVAAGPSPLPRVWASEQAFLWLAALARELSALSRDMRRSEDATIGEPPAAGQFASYRSTGGHAAAHVVVAPPR